MFLPFLYPNLLTGFSIKMGIILLDGGFVFWFFFCQLAYVNAVGTLFDEQEY